MLYSIIIIIIVIIIIICCVTHAGPSTLFHWDTHTERIEVWASPIYKGNMITWILIVYINGEMNVSDLMMAHPGVLIFHIPTQTKKEKLPLFLREREERQQGKK